MDTLSITITEKKSSYPIYFGKNLIEELEKKLSLNTYSKILIITDTNLEKVFLKKLQENISQKTETVILSPGEKAKTIESLQDIWKAMIALKLDRKSLVINLGGGVITDMGGFAAATYMRGIDFINIPTTLLSQVDASVGGKTGIDYAGVKNLLGTFNQPVGVIIDVATLQTLPQREFISGFAEIIKHGLIKDKKYFDQVIKKHPLDFTQDELIEIIRKSCEIKAAVVQQDETENGQRKILNFGHTIGHAIEALQLETEQSLLHGEAISLGMIVESEIAREKGLLSEAETLLIKDALHHMGLPITISTLSIDKVFKKIQSDKKNTFQQINFTLLDGIGNVVYNKTSTDEQIKKALIKIIK